MLSIVWPTERSFAMCFMKCSTIRRATLVSATMIMSCKCQQNALTLASRSRSRLVNIEVEIAARHIVELATIGRFFSQLVHNHLEREQFADKRLKHAAPR